MGHTLGTTKSEWNLRATPARPCIGGKKHAPMQLAKEKATTCATCHDNIMLRPYLAVSEFRAPKILQVNRLWLHIEFTSSITPRLSLWCHYHARANTLVFEAILRAVVHVTQPGNESHCLPVSPHVCLWWCVRLPDVLSPLVSNGHPLSPHMCACVGWRVRLPDVLSPLVSHCLPTCVPMLDCLSAFPRSCLPLAPIVSPCLPLSPFVSHCLPSCLPAPALPMSCLPLVSHRLPSCFRVLDGVSPFPRFCLLVSQLVFLLGSLRGY